MKQGIESQQAVCRGLRHSIYVRNLQAPDAATLVVLRYYLIEVLFVTFATSTIITTLPLCTAYEYRGTLRPLVDLASQEWFYPYYIVLKWLCIIVALALVVRACAREVEIAERRKYRKDHADEIAELQERHTIFREYENTCAQNSQQSQQHESTQQQK